MFQSPPKGLKRHSLYPSINMLNMAYLYWYVRSGLFWGCSCRSAIQTFRPFNGQSSAVQGLRGPFGGCSGAVRFPFRASSGAFRGRSGAIWEPFGCCSVAVQGPFGCRSGAIRSNLQAFGVILVFQGCLGPFRAIRGPSWAVWGYLGCLGVVRGLPGGHQGSSEPSRLPEAIPEAVHMAVQGHSWMFGCSQGAVCGH
jgi:hypothetical protein